MSLEMRSYVQRTVRERNELEVARRRAGDGGVNDCAEDNFGGGLSSQSSPSGGKGDGKKGDGKANRARKPTVPAAKK